MCLDLDGLEDGEVSELKPTFCREDLDDLFEKEVDDPSDPDLRQPRGRGDAVDELPLLWSWVPSSLPEVSLDELDEVCKVLVGDRPDSYAQPLRTDER